MRYRRNRPETMWHGTCTPLALEILASGGFVPEPPRKRWDASTGHMASYSGTYFTSNWMTAKAAALNAMKKFGGNEVIFQVFAELRHGIPDEDHLPHEHEVLAQSLGLSFLSSVNAWGILQEPKSKVQEFLDTATRTYFAIVEQRFLNAYGRHPGLGFSPAQREYLYPAVYYLMAVTLETIAGFYDPDKGYWSALEYKPEKQTPEIRRAINQVAVALTGILDQMSLDEWDPERFHIHNMRLDEPVGLGDGIHRIELAVEIIDPDRDRPTSPDNPHVLVLLYGRMTPEFLREFEKSQVGEGRMDLVRIETRAKLASNPPIKLPPEASEQERTVLMWIREFWAAKDDWDCSKDQSPVDAELNRTRMMRALDALDFFRVLRKSYPLQSPEKYMAQVWKKYHPKWRP